MDQVWNILKKHEDRLSEKSLSAIFSRFMRKWNQKERHKDAFRGIQLALCCDTRDPLKQNRVRYYTPINYRPSALIDELDWAWPVSAMGGFDDCGLTWVPPAGSVLVIFYYNADPDSAFYIGTTWSRDIGPQPGGEVISHNWGYEIPEFYRIWDGHRGGYMVGPDNESQNFPPWNTDNYQGYDIDSDGENDETVINDAQTKTTWPHIYGFVTPEKHRIKMDDGDPKCNRRWKRFELLSSLGHLILMKDDPYHPCGEWNNPKCCEPDAEPFVCYEDEDGDYICQQGPENCPTEDEPSYTVADETYNYPEQVYNTETGEWELGANPIRYYGKLENQYLGTEGECTFTPPSSEVDPVRFCETIMRPWNDNCSGNFNFDNTGRNIYHKHRQECYPYACGRCALRQSGIQILSRGGHTLILDDSVEDPSGRPEWENGGYDMDGCTGVFKGKSIWKSATGHIIELNDEEDQPKIRGIRNGINILTASGNKICLNDHSKPCCIAGELRGIHIHSTAMHTIDLVDEGNEQCSPDRTGCGNPAKNAPKAYIRIRSGYGLTFTMADFNNQRNTDGQYIQLKAPQKDNPRGPHMLHMQETADGPGQILLRAGGDYIVSTWDNMVEVVGLEKHNPANKLEFVSKKKIVKVSDVYYNKAKTHCFWADEHIFLLAGKDAPEEQPYVMPVVVACQPIPEYITQTYGIKASEHVYASALPCQPCISNIIS